MPEEGLITRTTSRADNQLITRGFMLILLLTTSIMVAAARRTKVVTMLVHFPILLEWYNNIYCYTSPTKLEIGRRAL